MLTENENDENLKNIYPGKNLFFCVLCMYQNKKKTVLETLGLLIFLLNFNTLYHRNKAVADLCSYKKLFLKSSKDYRPLGSAFNYETPCISLLYKNSKLKWE